MIEYTRSVFGLNLLFRINGSATYRSILPGLVGTAFFCWIRIGMDTANGMTDRELLHPYAVGVVVSGITFLIIFRASQGYSRYWEATSQVYHMMSKWMDSSSHAAVYHMQSERYNHIKPPSFNDYPELDALYLTRDRERVRNVESGRGTQSFMNHKRAVAKSINALNTEQLQQAQNRRQTPHHQSSRHFETPFNQSTINVHSPRKHSSLHPHFLSGHGRLDGNWGKLFPDGKATFFDPDANTIPVDKRGFASSAGGRTPSLFLQELAHLTSLMTAVALATLRNDVDGAESPLDYYEPGDPWPVVDPGDIPELYENYFSRAYAAVLFFLGRARTPEERTRYNALRPLPVIGGVSDNEIQFLQMARGHYAKTQLCWNWLSEFVTREHLAGSLGNVGPPIVSRCIQFLGDGMVHYNHARKIMFIPFPFPHAQLSAVFVIVIIPLIPLLMDQYCSDVWLGCVLTFLSLVCLSGIHEVARELENPFRNIPNELPVVTLMAQFNEALLTMYAGYHPDFFWEVDSATMQRSASNSPKQSPTAMANVHGDQDDQIPAQAVVNPRTGSLQEQDLGVEETGSTDDGSTVGEANGVQVSVEEKESNANQSEGADLAAPKNLTASAQAIDNGSSTTAIKSIDGEGDGENEPTPTTQPEMERTSEVDRLRAIVEEQGKIMAKMLEEQSRLNQMLQASFPVPTEKTVPSCR